MSDRIVYFDLETGGRDHRLHPIIQFAGVALEGWQEVGAIEVKLAFDPAACEPKSLAINSYDPEVWKREAVPPARAVAAIDSFLREHATLGMVSKRGKPWKACQLAGYNAASFDRPFLQQLFQYFDLFCVGSFLVLDAMHLAMWWNERLPPDRRPKNLQLPTVADHLGVRHTDAHDALGDVRATVEVARRIMESWPATGAQP